MVIRVFNGYGVVIVEYPYGIREIYPVPELI